MTLCSVAPTTCPSCGTPVKRDEAEVAAVLQLAGCGIDARGITQDVMLYAFLLDADPTGCGCDVLAEKWILKRVQDDEG